MTGSGALVLGFPVRHSRSPLIHGYWLRTHGLAGSYGKAEVRPEDFAAFVRGMPAAGLVGANCTIPHKAALFALADESGPTARALGAANTLWFEGGRLVADNTDVFGYLASLDNEAAGWARPGGRALVLGAGGAARGIVHGLMARGFADIAIANRSAERADEVARHFGTAARVTSFPPPPDEIAAADLLVNTTSLGMAGQPPLALDFSPLRRDAVVSDIVYVPLETQLVVQARAMGCRTVPGLGMLLHQAVPGFERWFGVRPTVTPELRRLVEADVTAHG
jgi:shikimate dehydrogenase